MNIEQTLKIALDQITSQMEVVLRLNTESKIDHTERAYVRNDFKNKSIVNREDFSGIFDVEYGFSQLFQLRIVDNKVINTLDDIDNKHLLAMEQKEKDLEQTIAVCNNSITHISSIIDTAQFNRVSLVNIRANKFYGFKEEIYTKFMNLSQYKNTAEVISKRVYYHLFTGGALITDQYEPVFSMQGVANRVKRDSMDYRLHRILCMLIKMNKRDLASVICRLFLAQLDIENI